MSKIYEPPFVEFIEFSTDSIVTSSGEIKGCKPGWGWGDQNHEHCGPPGQMKKY